LVKKSASPIQITESCRSFRIAQTYQTIMKSDMHIRPAYISSLTTAAPPHILDTRDVISQASAIFARFGDDFTRMLPVFASTGIERRYSVCPPAWFHKQNGWPERTEQFLEGAKLLFRQVSAQALQDASIQASEIDVIVTVSSTGIATPSIEAHVMHEMGFRDDVLRVPVFGLGCAGGVTGLRIAADLARAQKGRKVLLCVIELCTLSFRPDQVTKSNIVATALFGDGAAAAVLTDEGDGPAIEFSGQHTWNNTIDIMGWRVDPEGFGAVFSRSIPELTSRDLRPVADKFLADHNLSLGDIDNFSFHPGGTKVIQALEGAFELEQGELQHERSVLADFGNMSAPTAMFVLKEALADNAPGRRLVGALGPGFTASFLTLLQ
jgi:alkylresorcinol/alkylpyrone synthase